MLSSFLGKSLLKPQHSLSLVSQARFFGALSQSHLDSALLDPAHANWKTFFGGVNPSDVADSDPKTVSKLLVAINHANQNEESHKQEKLYQAIDEYFRKRFRKITSQEALDIVIPQGEQGLEGKLTGLDDKFWVWETLDESIRPVISELNEHDLMCVSRTFAANYKGSEDLWDFIHQRVHFLAAKPF